MLRAKLQQATTATNAPDRYWRLLYGHHTPPQAIRSARQGADQPIWLLMTLGHFSALQLAARPLAPFGGEAGSAQRPLAQLSAHRRHPLDRALATIDAATHTALSSEPLSEDESVGEDD